MIVNNPYTADSLFLALHASRGGVRYSEPYARVLRIAEYTVKQVNTDVIPWAVYSKVYAILSNAWSRLDDEVCIQEGFDL